VSALSSWNWSLAEDLAFWHDAGIDHVGIWTAKLDQAGWDAGLTAVRDGGLRVGNVMGAGPFTLDDPTRWPAERVRLGAMLDAAATLGARCLGLTTGPAYRMEWDAAARALSAALAPVIETGLPVPIAFEHTNSLRPDLGFVHSLADAVDLARRLGVGVCMECNACWAERDLRRTIETGVDVILMVQVDDFVVGTRDTPNRVVPGDGDIPLEGIVGHLLESGYRGDFDLELVGPRIEEEGYAAAIGRGVAAMTGMLDRLGA